VALLRFAMPRPEGIAGNLANRRYGASAFMQTLRGSTANPSLSREQQLREAILLTFCEHKAPEFERLQNVSHSEWQQLLYWLDTSGLALYFLNRISQLELSETLPLAVISRLQQNLIDNTERTNGMIAESTAIHRSFQEAGLSYAALKGFSLWPVSVPKPELRSQLDLDFLMAEESAAEARQILEARGYHLHAVSGRSWEFKIYQNEPTTLKDIYKATLQYAVELHLETAGTSAEALLPRREKLCFHGVCMPVLPRAELFIGQGMHLYKHVCSEFFRVAHMIEFRRHIIARYHDSSFWIGLRELAEGSTRIPISLGFITLLISQTMGDFAPEAFTCWTVDRLPIEACLWIELYGRRTVYANFPGSKLYLLLQRELQGAGLPAKRSLGAALLPRRLPPAITRGAPGETPHQHIRRYYKQIRFTLFRLRFHIVEGLNYLKESVRWRQYVNDLKGSGPEDL
jgi:Uncharacterised nucleotidyltransferase